MKAVFLDFSTMGPNLNVDSMRQLFPQLEVYASSTPAEVNARITDAEFVFANKIRMNDGLFASHPKLRFIGLTATGTDNVDLDAAKRAGVAVCNIRAYCTQSVAEHVLGCLLSLNRNLPAYARDVAAGEWRDSADFCLLTHPVRELPGLTLGIVGYGELGRGVAKLAEAFGMQVLVAARPGSEDVPEGRVSFLDLLHRSDVISLHCPLNDATRNLFDADAFREMKNDAVLINTARGALIDTAALSAALQDGQIAAAAVDVLPQEPPVDGDPLLDYNAPNLLVTPHIAWASHTARQAAIDELVANARSFLDGGDRNRVV